MERKTTIVRQQFIIFRTRSQRLAFGLSALVIMSAAALAFAAGQARDYIHPSVRRSHYQQFAGSLDLSREQRVIVQMFFNDYRDALENLVDRTDERAEGAGRSTIDAALRGQASIEYERLQQMRADVWSVYRAALPEAHQLLRRMLDDTYHILNDDQVADFESAARTLRRQVLLHPYQNNEHDPSYAGDGVDVMQLIEQASRDGGELVDLPNGALNDVRSAYVEQLDAWLQAVEPGRRLTRMDQRIASIRGDRKASREHENTSLRMWQQLYELNESTANEVAKIVHEQAGQRAALAWRARFHGASYPWLFKQRTPDRQYDWLMNQSLSAPQRNAVQERYHAYLTKRQALRQAAIDLMLKARIEHGEIVHPRMGSSELSNDATREIYQQLVRNSGELQTLHDQAADRIASAVDADLRRRLNLDM